MLLPALSKARAAAQSIKCVSNVKQMCLGAFIYANDNDNHLPGAWQGGNNYTTSGPNWDPSQGDIHIWWADSVGDNWMYQVWKAGIDKTTFVCPGKSMNMSYGDANFKNTNYPVGYSAPSRFYGLDIGAAKRPSEQVMVLDSDIQQSFYRTLPAPGWSAGQVGFSVSLHGDKWSLGFIDGHAEAQKGNTLSNTDYKMFSNENI